MTYWSNSKFAARLRKLFGLPKQPEAATSVGWEKYEEHCRSINTIGHEIVEGLDSIQRVIMYIPNRYTDTVYWLSNSWNNVHMMPSLTKRGKYTDLVSKIPESLTLSVIDFVEQECFWACIRWDESEQTNPIIAKYMNQSYFRRKLFPMRVSESVRGQYGIKYLNFQKKHNPKAGQDEIIAAYYFAKTYVVMHTRQIGYCNRYDKLTDDELTDLEDIEKWQKQCEPVLELHCINLIKFRQLLWT